MTHVTLRTSGGIERLLLERHQIQSQDPEYSSPGRLFQWVILKLIEIFSLLFLRNAFVSKFKKRALRKAWIGLWLCASLERCPSEPIKKLKWTEVNTNCLVLLCFRKIKARFPQFFSLIRAHYLKRLSSSTLNIYFFAQTLLYVFIFIFIHAYVQPCDKWQHNMEMEIWNN